MVGAILLHDSALINIVSLEECISEFTEIKTATEKAIDYFR